MKVRLFMILAWVFLVVSHSKAQTDTIAIKEVVFSAGRSPVQVRQMNRTVTLWRKDTAGLLPEIDVSDILEVMPAVDLRERGPFGVQADVQLRGGTFNQTLITINGFPINDPQTGHLTYNIPLTPIMLDRIEVIKGAASRILGPDAFSGSVGFYLSEPEKPFFQAALSAGQHHLWQAAISAGTGTDNFSVTGSYTWTKSGGYRPNTDFNDHRGILSAVYQKHNTKVSFLGSWVRKSFGANSFYTPVYPDQYEAYRTWFTGLKLETGRKVQYRQMIWYKKSFDRFELFRNDPAPWYPGHNYHGTATMATAMNVSVPTMMGITSLGADIRALTLNSNALGAVTGDTLPVPGEPEGIFTRGARRGIANIYIEHRYVKNRWSVSGGAMLSNMSGYGWRAYGGVATGWQIDRKIHVYLSANQSLRYPTFTELYYNGPTNEGNPDLNPEQAVTVEVGVRYANRYLAGNFVVFNRHGKNLIDWGRLSDTLIWKSMNLTALNTTGIESEWRWDFRKNMLRKEMFIKSAGFSFYYAFATKSSGAYLSRYVLDYLKYQAVFNLEHAILGPLSAKWQWRLQDRAGTYAEYPSGEEVAYPAYLLNDLTLEAEWTHLALRLQLRNLWDKEYVDLANIPMPGRWAVFTASLSF